MDFSKKLNTIKYGWSIIYMEGLQVITSKIYVYWIFLKHCSIELSILYFIGLWVKSSVKWWISVPEDCFNFAKTLQTLMKCRIMRYFNWVCTVCQNTYLGFSVYKGLKTKYSMCCVWALTLCLLVLSADNFWKQFGPRSGPTFCRAWSGTKLFDTLNVFLK